MLGDVRQSHRGRAKPPRQPAAGLLREMALAVVEKEPRPAAQTVQKQIKVAVAIHVREDASGRKLVRAGETGGGRDILEFPISEVPVQRVGAFQTAKVHVHQTVSVDVPECDARADLIKTVLGRRRVRQQVGERDSGLLWSEQGEAGPGPFRGWKPGKPVSRPVLPDQILRGGSLRNGNQAERQGERGPCDAPPPLFALDHMSRTVLLAALNVSSQDDSNRRFPPRCHSIRAPPATLFDWRSHRILNHARAAHARQFDDLQSKPPHTTEAKAVVGADRDVVDAVGATQLIRIVGPIAAAQHPGRACGAG